jgi:hypothetical protein
MNVPIWIEQRDGKYIATAVNSPEITVESTTRDGVIARMSAKLQFHKPTRELVMIDVPTRSNQSVFGSMKGDPDLSLIVAEAYRIRDEEAKQEYPHESV